MDSNSSGSGPFNGSLYLSLLDDILNIQTESDQARFISDFSRLFIGWARNPPYFEASTALGGFSAIRLARQIFQKIVQIRGRRKTYRLKGRWPEGNLMNRKNGAGDGIRTHDNHVGNVMLYP